MLHGDIPFPNLVMATCGEGSSPYDTTATNQGGQKTITFPNPNPKLRMMAVN